MKTKTVRVMGPYSKVEKLILFELYNQKKPVLHCHAALGLNLAGVGVSAYSFKRAVNKMRERGFEIIQTGNEFRFSNTRFRKDKVS